MRLPNVEIDVGEPLIVEQVDLPSNLGSAATVDSCVDRQIGGISRRLS